MLRGKLLKTIKNTSTLIPFYTCDQGRLAIATLVDPEWGGGGPNHG